MADAPYTPLVRRIRQANDPTQIYDRSNVTQDQAQQSVDFQQQATEAAIQKRMEEQAKRQAEAERKRQQEQLAASQRAAASTASRNAAYQKKLENYINTINEKFAAGGTPQLTLDPSASSGKNHTAAYQKALNYANKQVTNPTQDWTRDCQMFARKAAHASAFGTSALKAWQGTPEEHKHYTYPPKPGSIAYYANPKNPGAGHAVFVGDNGKVYSTDIKRTGKIDIVNWNVFQDKWNMQFLGWIDATPSGKLPVQW